MGFDCIICFADVDPDKERFYRCGDVDPDGHSTCLSCFSNYVKHCCENYAVGDKIPLTCVIPDCEYTLPDTQIRDLLTQDDDVKESGIWEMYQTTSIKVALDSRILTHNELPVTCHICNYTEVLIAAPPKYWEQLQRIKNVGRLMADASAKEWLRKEEQRIKAECLDRRTDINQECDGRIQDARDVLAQHVQQAEEKFGDSKRQAEEEKESEIETHALQRSATEASYWDTLAELHLLYWNGEPLGSRSIYNEQVKVMMEEEKMEEVDFMILFEVIPHPQDGDSDERKQELRTKLMTQLRLKGTMLNQELQTVTAKLDEVFFSGDMILQEKIKLYGEIKEQELEQPRLDEQKEIQEIQDDRSGRVNVVNEDEARMLQDAGIELDRQIEASVRELDSPGLRAKLRTHLMHKVQEIDGGNSPEKGLIDAVKGIFSKDAKPEVKQGPDDDAKYDVLLDLDVMDLIKTFEGMEDVKADAPENETSQYFICKRQDCTGAICVRCHERLTQNEVEEHVCKEDALMILFRKVLELLAEASCQACPGCNEVWRKDLACTHMYCEKCSTYWCYHCGQSKDAVGGNFGPHNEWYINTPDEEKKCPMYLRYRYGDVENDGATRREGDAKKSLEKYHRKRQEDAINLYKPTVDAELWDAMMEQRFPDGFWD